MATARLATLPAVIVIGQACLCTASAQNADEAGAITARVHGTFQDKAGGLGVLSGDMIMSGFDVRTGTLTAIGRIVGGLADAAGNVLPSRRQNSSDNE